MQLVRCGIYINQKTGEKHIYLGRFDDSFKIYSISEGVIYDILEKDLKLNYKRIHSKIKKGDIVRVLSRDEIDELMNLRFDDLIESASYYPYTFPASWDSDMYRYCGETLKVDSLLDSQEGRYKLEDLNGNKNWYYFDAEMLMPSQAFVRRF